MPSEINRPYAARRTRLAGYAGVATAALAAAVLIAVTGCGPALGARPGVIGPGSPTVPAPSTSVGLPGSLAASAPSTLAGTPARPATKPSSTHAAEPRCGPGQLTATVVSAGSVANQPFAIVALRNHGVACYLDGYPKISGVRAGVLLASGGHGPSASIDTAVRDGEQFEHSDPGPSHVDLASGGSASFSMGTTTALDNPIYVITSLVVVPPGAIAGVPLTLDLAASARAHQAVPILVTALVAGSAGPPAQ